MSGMKILFHEDELNYRGLLSQFTIMQISMKDIWEMNL